MSILRQIFETLREYYAAKPVYQWWPDDPIEVILGAVLVTGSTWKSADKVLNVFRAKELLDFDKILLLTEEHLAELIRPVGFQTKKAKRIRDVAQLILDRSDGDLDRFFTRDIDQIRRELLSISGIGSGTADNILLYAGQVPVYVVDKFTVRLLVRHGIADERANVQQIQELIHKELTPDEEPYGAKLFQQMQEFLVHLGRDFCDKSKPDCSQCPLNIYLPEGGALRNDLLSVTKHKQHVVIPKTIESKPITAVKTLEEADLNETERKIIETVGGEPMSIDVVVAAVKLPVHIVRATIAVLQMKKILVQVEGNQVKRLK